MPFTRSKRKFRCLKRKTAVKQLFIGIKSAASAIRTGASSYEIHSKPAITNRLVKVRILKDGEADSIKYLTNGLGQQVFKSEPKSDQLLSN